LLEVACKEGVTGTTTMAVDECLGTGVGADLSVLVKKDECGGIWRKLR